MPAPVDIVVLAGGDRDLGAAALAGLDLDAHVIAADSGVELADLLGLHVDRAVGDFDSIGPGRLERLLAQDATQVDIHPRDKDASDLDLALRAALADSGERGRRVLVAGVEGGRADHGFANLALVASDRFADIDVTVALAGATVTVVRRRTTLRTTPGTTLSMIPVHGPATVSLEGVRWPLDRQSMEPGTSWGMSNEATADTVTVTVHAGTALLFVLDAV